MTDTEKTLLDAINEMAQQAPSVGLCSAPFKIMHEQVAAIIAERDELLKYRTPTPVEPKKGWYGKCPTCGAVFLDPYLPYCGNCGQALIFE